jgi:hypothetical protein
MKSILSLRMERFEREKKRREESCRARVDEEILTPEQDEEETRIERERRFCSSAVRGENGKKKRGRDDDDFEEKEEGEEEEIVSSACTSTLIKTFNSAAAADIEKAKKERTPKQRFEYALAENRAEVRRAGEEEKAKAYLEELKIRDSETQRQDAEDDRILEHAAKERERVRKLLKERERKRPTYQNHAEYVKHWEMREKEDEKEDEEVGKRASKWADERHEYWIRKARELEEKSRKANRERSAEKRRRKAS